MTDTPATFGGASDEDILSDLKSASAGLNYPSESDAPFVLYYNPSNDDMLAKVIPSDKTRVTETSVDDFFAELVAGEDGAKFQRLRRVIESRLAGVRVLRIGEIEVDVYLVGRTPGGAWAGLHTTSVET